MGIQYIHGYPFTAEMQQIPPLKFVTLGGYRVTQHVRERGVGPRTKGGLGLPLALITLV